MTLGESFSSTLTAARAGAEWAWAVIYRDLVPVVLGYVRARGAHEREDVLAEAFLDAVRNLAGFDGDERQFRTWVLQSSRVFLPAQLSGSKKPLQV